MTHGDPHESLRLLNAPGAQHPRIVESMRVRLRAARAHLPFALRLLVLVTALESLWATVGVAFDRPATMSNLVSEFGLSVASMLPGFGLPLLAAVVAFELAPPRGLFRWAWLGIALVLSVWGGITLRDLQVPPPHLSDSKDFVTNTFVSALLFAIYAFHRRGVAALEQALALRTERAALEAEQSKARLQALRAQIEPHFLFNTLANVRRLYEIDARAGAAMLASLIRYVGMALPSMRREHTPLRDEAELIRAYLDLYQVRMGPRLAYEIAFPPELLGAAVPPMMLLTLVENAIKHGLAPLPEGGEVRISARSEGATLEVHVADSGRGLSAGTGHGTGLANIRARLAGLYGDAARLSLGVNRPRGVIATLSLPVSMGAA